MKELWTWRTGSCSQSPRSSLTKGTISRCFAEWGEKDKVVAPHPKCPLNISWGRAAIASGGYLGLGIPQNMSFPRKGALDQPALPAPHEDPREGLP